VHHEQCPAYEAAYEELLNAGADEVYCLAVNDAFVMYQWTRHLGLTKLKVLPTVQATSRVAWACS
jgi:peroxiredoxin